MSKTPTLLLLLGITSLVLFATVTRAEDWPQWCGGLSRNSISRAKDLPNSFDPRSSSSDGATCQHPSTVVTHHIERQTHHVIELLFITDDDYSIDCPRPETTAPVSRRHSLGVDG